MKLIHAIVSNDDAARVQGVLVEYGFQLTRLSSMGGFLMAGNTTFICAAEDDRVDSLIQLIKSNTKPREKRSASRFSDMIDVSVGGATIIVTDIERFEKV